MGGEDHLLKAVVLAAEQLNDEGGVLGRQIEVAAEDSDIGQGVNAAKINLALTRLLTLHKVDFVIGTAGSEGFMVQELLAEHKRIFFEITGTQNEFTQRVLDDYERYKYYFRVTPNATATLQSIIDPLLFLREQTGFNKIGYLGQDLGLWHDVMEGLDYILPEVHGFDLVFGESFLYKTFDFTSYFARAEAAGVEIMVPLIRLGDGIPFVKEYTDRESPMVICGALGYVSDLNGWKATDGKCEYTTSEFLAIKADYPFTKETQPARVTYMERWGIPIEGIGPHGYDVMRFILPDAIKRAGTIETDAVIRALETTIIETTNARNFAFTSSHDMMLGDPNNPESDYPIKLQFQWQNGELAPIFPKWLMEEAGATYQYPPWNGPWD